MTRHQQPVSQHDALAPGHEHGWITESEHRTSGGTIAYVKCTSCGALRVDLRDGLSSCAVSAPVRPPRTRDDTDLGDRIDVGGSPRGAS